MKPRAARRLRDNIFVIGFVITMVSCWLYEPLVIPGCLIILSCLIPDYLYNKCPHCQRHLGRNEGHFCPHCGEQID